MDARIQFRVSEETKRLAQQYADSKGSTLSDECRKLAERMALSQKEQLSHTDWLDEQVRNAFAKLQEGKSQLLTQEQAKSKMEERKDAIRRRKIQNYA